MSRRNSLIDPTTILAHGPGLTGGKVNEECKFRIEGTDGGLALSFHIEGPAKPMFETSATNNMSIDICYVPRLAGDYVLSLLWYGKHIEGSPFKLKVTGGAPPASLEELVKRVRVSGRGLESARTNQYNEVLVDCRKVYLKDHKLRCSVKSPPKSSAMVKVDDNGDGTYTMSFKPTFTGVYQLNIRVDDTHVAGSPFSSHVRS